MVRQPREYKASSDDAGSDSKKKSAKNKLRHLSGLTPLLNYVCVEHWLLSALFFTAVGLVALAVAQHFGITVAGGGYIGAAIIVIYFLLAAGYVILKNSRSANESDPPQPPSSQRSASMQNSSSSIALNSSESSSQCPNVPSTTAALPSSSNPSVALVPIGAGLPGFSFHLMIRINNIPAARRKYIFDMGRTDGERLSIYVSSDNILTVQFVDAKHEIHPLQIPFGFGGLSIGKFEYLGFELGISGMTTELRLFYAGNKIGEQILPFKTDVGSLNLPDSALGADLDGSNGACFDLRDWAAYSSTFATEDLKAIAEYFESRKADEIPYIEFDGNRWFRYSSLPHHGGRGMNQPNPSFRPRYRIPKIRAD